MFFKLLKVSIKYPYGLRILSSSTEKVNFLNEKTASASIKFSPIYKFPYIRVFSIVNRLKLYQTFLTITTVPSCVILHQMNLVPIDALFMAIAFGISGSMLLYSLGYFSQKFIGFVYLSEDESTIKVSSVDFWGKRKDDFVPLQDVVPLSDLPASFTDGLFVKFSRFSKNDHLRLCLKYGIVLDQNGFNKVFK